MCDEIDTNRGLPTLVEETERKEQAAFWQLESDATWPEIRACAFAAGYGVFYDPISWEMTMIANFGSDLFEVRKRILA